MENPDCGIDINMRSPQRKMASRILHAKNMQLFDIAAGHYLWIEQFACSSHTGNYPRWLSSRILDEYILNGTIILILITCIISSLVTQKAAKELVMERKEKGYFTPAALGSFAQEKYWYR